MPVGVGLVACRCRARWLCEPRMVHGLVRFVRRDRHDIASEKTDNVEACEIEVPFSFRVNRCRTRAVYGRFVTTGSQQSKMLQLVNLRLGLHAIRLRREEVRNVVPRESCHSTSLQVAKAVAHLLRMRRYARHFSQRQQGSIFFFM